MKIDRPLWAAGALLSSQQFQQQARREACSQQLLERQAARQKTCSVVLGFSEEQGITLQFIDALESTEPVVAEREHA